MSHIMLSYNWNSQKLVKKIYTKLVDGGIPCWMDIQGGMKVNMMTAMSEGVENAAAIIPFCTEKYQNSQNCQTELSYAYEEKIPIIPVICDDGYTKKQKRGEIKEPSKWPCGWLAFSIAGRIYVDFRKNRDFDMAFESLVKNIENETSFIWTQVKSHSIQNRVVNWSKF